MERPRVREALGLLGLARRAGRIEPGVDRTRRALRSGEARLVVVAEDASPTQLGKIEGLIDREAVPRVILGDRVALGAAVGGPPLSAVAVTDARLAEQVLGRMRPDGSRNEQGPEDDRRTCG